MPLMYWQETYCLGINEFDDHHKHIVFLLNKVYDNFTSGANHEALEGIIDDLISYTAYHFGAEEQWMSKHNYTDFSIHKNEHDKLKNKVMNFQKDFVDGKRNISLDLMTFLMFWLSDHILVSDSKLGKFINVNQMTR